jgi:hypothetical protein
MTDPLKALLQHFNIPQHNLPVNSRYHHVGTTVREGQDGQPIVYLKRRFVPPPEQYLSQQAHLVKHRERLDNITADYLGDPEQFWQIADANAAMKPQELTEKTGRKLIIPQASGISGF